MFKLHPSQAQLHPQSCRVQSDTPQAEGVDINTIVSDCCLKTWILLSSISFSEQKLDGIAEDIDGIKQLLLQGLNVPQDQNRPTNAPRWHPDQADSVKPLIKHQPTTIHPCRGEPVWDHPPHIIDFVKAVVKDINSRDVRPEANEVLSSLRNIVQTLEGPPVTAQLPLPKARVGEYHEVSPRMPPLEAVVDVLRWAKGTYYYILSSWTSKTPQFD